MVPAPVMRVSNSASYGNHQRGIRQGTGGSAYQSHCDDQNGDDSIEGHEDVIQSADGAVEVPHGVFNGELFTVTLPIGVSR